MLKEWLAQSVSSQVLMLDSAGLLNFWNWQWLRLKTRHHAGIVITSHRAGRLPTLIRCETSPELLESLVNQLTAEQNCSEMVDVAKLHSLFRTHSGNIRDCLRALYDEFAKLPHESAD